MNDFIYHIGSSTNIIGKPPKFYSTTDLLNINLRFASVYGVRKADARAIEEAGTAAGFRGVVWSERLWVDIDTAEGAKEALNALHKLGVGYDVYTTGNRGVHISIKRLADPSHLLPLQDKAWVKTYLPMSDMSLYWHLHLLRLEGAIHELTGNPKQRINSIQGPGISLPRLDLDAISKLDTPPVLTESKPLFSVWSVVERLTGDGEGGSRHRQLVNLAMALRRDAGASFKDALFVMREVNRGFSDSKPIDEVERIAKWAYNAE